VKNTGPVIGKEEWTFRLAPGIEHDRLNAEPNKPYPGRQLTCDQSSGILALDVVHPDDATVFIVSKIPHRQDNTSGLNFKVFGDESDGATE
jgi:hypothetical protein